MKTQDNTKVVPVVIQYKSQMTFRFKTFMDGELLEDFEMGNKQFDINLLEKIKPKYWLPEECIEEYIDENKIEVSESSDISSNHVKPLVILYDGDSFKTERITYSKI